MGSGEKKGREKGREALRLADSVFELFLNILTTFFLFASAVSNLVVFMG